MKIKYIIIKIKNKFFIIINKDRKHLKSNLANEGGGLDWQKRS